MDQLTYLEILLGDAGFTNRKQRNAYLSRVTQREIKYLDDLSPGERSGLINTLRDMAKLKKEERDDRDEEDE